MFREINYQKNFGFCYADLRDRIYELVVVLVCSCHKDPDCCSVWEALKFQNHILSHVTLYNHLQSPFKFLVIISLEML